VGPAELHICFVCTGNICRSPIAEKVLVHELALAGLDGRVRVTSAGTGGWNVGNAADERVVRLLHGHGYATAHTARQLDAQCLAADLLVALDNEHRRVLRAKVPEPERVRMLRSFDPAAPSGAEVPDPYFGVDDGFVEVLGMVRAAMPGLLAWVCARLPD